MLDVFRHKNSVHSVMICYTSGMVQLGIQDAATLISSALCSRMKDLCCQHITRFHADPDAVLAASVLPQVDTQICRAL